MRWFWIDRFVEFERGKRAVAIKNVSLVEEQIDEYISGYPVMPFSLMIEGMAQTAGLLVGEMGGFKERVVLAKLNKATCHRVAIPGDSLRYTAVIHDVQKDGAIVHVTSHLGEIVQAEVEMMFAFLDGRFPDGPLFNPVEFVTMIRAFGMYDVGRTSDGQPLELPEFYAQAEREATAAYPTGPV